MTETGGRRPRWSKNRLRAVAWLAGGLAFVASGTAIGLAPKPPHDAARPRRPHPAPRKTIIKHRVIRRVVVDPPVSIARPSVTYVATGDAGGGTTSVTTTASGGGTPGSSSGGGGSTGGSSSGGSSSGSGGTTTTTGGS